jgi:hypothetical protein
MAAVFYLENSGFFIHKTDVCTTDFLALLLPNLLLSRTDSYLSFG